MMMRSFIAGLAGAAVFFMSPWVALVLSGALALRFFAWEAIAVGFLGDILYAPHGAFFGVPLPGTLLMLFVVVALAPWRAQLALRL